MVNGRNTCGAWLLAVLLIAAAPAIAQDPRESTVGAAARDWLALIDKGDYDASWKAAGAKFRAAMSTQQWGTAVGGVRAPLGSVKQRSSVRTAFTREFQGVPEGDYALVNYRTSFEKRDDSDETVTLERESDGQWRVIGYFIR
jgi:hypothetical protein